MAGANDQAIASQKQQVHDFRSKFLSKPFLPLGKLKQLLSRDAGFKGPVWLAYSQIDSPPEPDLRDLVWEVVCNLNAGNGILQKPDYAPSGAVWGEWMGRRKDETAVKHAPIQTQSREDAEDSYRRLSDEAESATTTLFFHGGTYVFGSPATSRSVLSHICEDTGGRSFSATYRLAPEHLFPGYLVDALVVYLSLLYPPPGALHAPVPPHALVLAGESAGAGICLALTQILLKAQGRTIRFHGQTIPLPLPAGLALHSPPSEWMMVLPSSHAYFFPDYISGDPPYHAPDYPADALWPASPPRAEVHVDGSALLHPLISLCAAAEWKGCPPLMITLGQERLLDGNLVMAQQAARQGVHVELVVYEYMPHAFAMVLQGKVPQARHCLQQWSRAIREFGQGAKQESPSSARFVKLGDLREEAWDVYKLIGLDAGQALEFMKHYLPGKVATVWEGTRVVTARTGGGKARL